MALAVAVTLALPSEPMTAGLPLRTALPSEPMTAGLPLRTVDVAGDGDGFTAGLLRHSQRKRGATDRPSLRGTAPALDPTLGEGVLATAPPYPTEGAEVVDGCGGRGTDDVPRPQFRSTMYRS